MRPVMKRIIVLFFLWIPMTLWAIDINNPADPLYKNIEIWQERGLLGHLPVIRPYPTQLLLTIFNKVIEKGTARDAELAQFYLNEIDQSLRMDIAVDAQAAVDSDLDSWGYGGFLVGIKGILTDNLSCWGDLGGNVIFGEEFPYYTHYSALPYGERDSKDVVNDSGKIGDMSILQGLDANMALGSDHLYLNLGLSRTSFGAINRDSIIISTQAPQAARMDFTWWGDKYSYSILMMQLTATNGLGRDPQAGKYLFMHSYNWAPLDWLELGFIDTVVGSFQPAYLLPFSELFYNQGVYGFKDNSQMGLTIRSRLPRNIELNGACYVDDISFNDYVKFNFDSKLKAAFQGGISWTPTKKWLYRLNADYTLLTPYMYTHEAYIDADDDGDDNETRNNTINMTNYTHQGQSLGATLSPNSDRIYAEVQIRPSLLTDLYLHGTFIRHGNGSVEGSTNLADPEGDNASQADFVVHDGSIFDGGISDDGVRTFDLGLNLLNQDVLEKVLKFGMGMETDLPMPLMDEKEYFRMRFNLDYTFEMIWNSSRNSVYGMDPVKGDDEINHYLALGFRILF